MKKFLLLLCTLLASVGVGNLWATVTMPTLTTDPANPVLYCIQSYRSYRYVQYAGDDVKMTQTFDCTSDDAKFYFLSVNGTDYSDGVKIVNVNGKQINEMSGFAAEGTTWYLGESTYGNGGFNISKNSSITDPCWDCNASGVMTADYWYPNTEGSTWQIEKAPQYETSTLVSPKWYYLKTGRGRYVYADGSNAGTTTTNPKTDAYKFAFVQVSGTGVNIVSKAGLDGGSNQYLSTSSPYLSDDAETWYYFGAAQYPGYFVFSDTSEGYGYPHLLNDNGAGGLAKWYIEGTGSYFQVEEVLPVCDVTYTYTFGGNTYSETETQNIGDPVSLPASINFPFTNYTFDKEVVPDAATATVNVTVAGFNMPFATSTDYASAKWYFLHGHATYGHYYVSRKDNATVWNNVKDYKDSYFWAFIGNPIDGIKIINKAAGDGVYLMDTETATTLGSTATEWVLKKQTSSYSYGGSSSFGFWSTTRNNYANCAGGTVKYWGSFDQGSTFWVDAQDVETLFDNDITALQALDFGSGYGQYSLTGDYAGYTASANGIVDVLDEDGFSCDNLERAETLLNNYTFNLPAAGTFLRVETSPTHIATPTYLTSSNIIVGGYNNCAFTQENSKITGAETILYYDGTSLLGYTTGIWLKNDAGFAIWNTEPSVSGTSVAFMEAANGVKGKYNIKFNNARYLYTTSDANGIYSNAGSSANAEGYNFVLEKVTSLPVSITAAGYATLCAPVALTIPTGVTAYTIVVESDNSLTMTALDGKIPAGTPVVLEGAAGSYNFDIATADAFDGDNDLVGTYATILAPAGEAILQNQASGVGFYRVDLDYLEANSMTRPNVPGFRAYLDIPAVGVKAFFFNKTDVIKDVFKGVAAGEIYDLSGAKVAKMQKGKAYIVNGTSVIMK